MIDSGVRIALRGTYDKVYPYKGFNSTAASKSDSSWWRCITLITSNKALLIATCSPTHGTRDNSVVPLSKLSIAELCS